jgi:hypothetical protein
MRTDPAAQLLEERDDVFVFKLNGDLDPGSCPARGYRPTRGGPKGLADIKAAPSAAK